MILSSHLCLLTDGSFGRFPVARIGAGGTVESLDLCPDGPDEIGGMVFRGGIMVCGLPDRVMPFQVTDREDFVMKMRQYPVTVGTGPVAILHGCDLNSFSGVFSVWRPVKI